jgi:hypothetical protein
MRKRESVSWTVAAVCVAVVGLGVGQCPVQDTLKELAAVLAGHEERLQRVEECTCCCDGRFQLVCGADGITYLNRCEARCAGTTEAHQGRCELQPACPDPNPAGCAQTGCPSGQVCFRDGSECIPSACSCDGATGQWICTDDCGGGRCIDTQPACPDPNPAGCAQTGCPSGQVCYRDGSQCIPSACSCDPATGGWICTDDCGGGRCI